MANTTFDRMILPAAAAGMLCIGVAFAATTGAEVAKEYSHRNDTFAAATDVHFVKGSCKSRVFVMTECSLTLRDARKWKKISKSYVFAGPAPQKRVAVLRSQQDKTYVTTSIGRDTLWGCMLMADLGTGFFFGIGGYMLTVKPQRPDGAEEAGSGSNLQRAI